MNKVETSKEREQRKNKRTSCGFSPPSGKWRCCHLASPPPFTSHAHSRPAARLSDARERERAKRRSLRLFITPGRGTGAGGGSTRLRVRRERRDVSAVLREKGLESGAVCKAETGGCDMSCVWLLRRDSNPRPGG